MNKSKHASTKRNTWTDAEKAMAVHRCVNLGEQSIEISKELGVSNVAFSAWRVKLVGKSGDPKYASRCTALNARMAKRKHRVTELKQSVTELRASKAAQTRVNARMAKGKQAIKKLNDAVDESIALAMREPTPVIECITPQTNGRDTDTPAVDSMEVLDIAIQVAAHTLKDLEQRKRILTQQYRITELETRLRGTSVPE